MNAALDALRHAYQAKLPAKLEQIREALRAWRAGDADESELLLLVHRLHGTAGSYGFHDVSRVAGNLEHMVRSCQGVPVEPPWNALQACVNALGGEDERT